MPRTEQHTETIKTIDMHLTSNTAFEPIRLSPDGRAYKSWYAKLLSGFAIIVGDDEVVYAHANYEAGKSSARIVAYTTRILMVADVAELDVEEAPSVQVLNRKSLESFTLRAKERVDSHDGRSLTWPGALEAQLDYRGFDGQIEIAGNGYNNHNVNEFAPIVRFIASLREDVASS